MHHTLISIWLSEYQQYNLQNTCWYSYNTYHYEEEKHHLLGGKKEEKKTRWKKKDFTSHPCKLDTSISSQDLQKHAK